MTGREHPSRPLAGVALCILRGTTVLLVRRGRPPGQGTWSLPGGAQKLGETVENAARREAAEETGLCLGKLHLADVLDVIVPGADGGIAFHYTLIAYAAGCNNGTATPGTDATDLRWANIDALDRFTITGPVRSVIRRSQELLRAESHPSLPLP